MISWPTPLCFKCGEKHWGPCSGIAQMEEQKPLELPVEGSNPSPVARIKIPRVPVDIDQFRKQLDRDRRSEFLVAGRKSRKGRGQKE